MTDNPNIRKNFETFDLWSKAKFAMWSNIRYDFELIAELTRYRRSTKQCLDILDTVNRYLKNPPERVFFDGTIKCLKYLIKNNYLDLKDLPTLTHDEKYLVELLQKYSNRLDITDVISDIEEPTLRVMLMEYPHLISEVLRDNPIAGHMVGKAMLKNGITDADNLIKKVDDGKNSIEVDKQKNSKEAMKCKIIYLGLRINNRKISIPRGATEIINQFKNLSDTVVENETYERGIFNSLYAAFYGSDFWNEDKKAHLSGCDTLYLDFQLLSLPANHMSMIYDIFLAGEVDKIGKKYFGNSFKHEGFIASLAIKMAVLIILFRTENFIPKGEVRNTDIFDGATMLNDLNYAVRETGNKDNPLELKKWFIEYFRDELDKRVAFIKMQIENNVGLFEMMGGVRVVYLPVFETFRFFCQRDGLLQPIIKLFKNKEIPNSVKDEIFINFALNIQKIAAETEVAENENRIKDTFILLIREAFAGLARNIVKVIKERSKKFYDDEDFMADASVAVIELILGFDLLKNNSFIGYLVSNLKFKMITAGRMNKADWSSDIDSNFEEGFLESIPDEADFLMVLEDGQNVKRIKDYIDKLPEKEREAVKKLVQSNEKLTDTERKAKNRGLNKIREIMGVS